MKNLIKYLCFCFAIIYGVQVRAQDNRQQVAYLKNGTEIRGQIVERIFNESITIQTANGEKIKIPVSELQRVAIEDNDGETEASHKIKSTDTAGKIKKVRPSFSYPGKQFFFQGEFVGGYAEFGFRFVGGYRFGQFGILGGGVGVDGVLGGFPFNNNSADPNDGVYFPIFAHYEGDILKNNVTPFYCVDAGYAFRYSMDDSYITVTPLDHPVYKNQGGFTGGVGFGVKAYFKKRVYASWGVGIDVKQAQDKYSNYYINSIGENIKVSYSSSSFYYLPVFKMDVGF